MNSNDMNYLVDTVAEGFVDSMMKLATKKSKPLDRTYTGRIMSIGTNGKCQVMYSNKSCWVDINDGNAHYVNELVRVYIPNGDIDKAYAESISPAPLSKVVISENQLVFKTVVSTPVFSNDGNGNPNVEFTNVNIEKVVELKKDNQGRIISVAFPDTDIIEIEYQN